MGLLPLALARLPVTVKRWAVNLPDGLNEITNKPWLDVSWQRRVGNGKLQEVVRHRLRGGLQCFVPDTVSVGRVDDLTGHLHPPGGTRWLRSRLT